MKRNFLISIIIIFSINFSFGQDSGKKRLTKTEEKIINNLSSMFKDTSITFLFSPFVVYPIDKSHIDGMEIMTKYGFNKNELNKTQKDTFLLGENNYFKIVNPDSLARWQEFKSDNSFEDLTLRNIAKYYKKQGICSFHKMFFSKDKRYAIVQYWMQCGFLCGYGETVLMKKTNQYWLKMRTLVSRRAKIENPPLARFCEP